MHKLDGSSNRVLVSDRNDTIYEVDTQGIWLKARAKSFNTMRPRPSTGRSGTACAIPPSTIC